jgi:hypothetical protein
MTRPSPERSYGSIPTNYTSSSGYSDPNVKTFVKYDRTWSGTTTPNYYELSKRYDALPINNHSMKLTTRQERTVSQLQVNKPGGDWTLWVDTYRSISGYIHQDYSYSLSHSKQAFEQAKARCLTKVKDMDINVAQAVAEAQRTMDLVGDTARTIAKSVVLFRKGKFKQGFKSLGISRTPNVTSRKGASDNWLAVQYGWLPLLSDVKGAVEALAKRSQPPLFVFHGKATAMDSQQHIFEPVGGSGGVHSWELGYNSSTKFVLAFNKKNHVARTLSQLGISDPALLVWELLPYSFVVDWFFPIGKYLETLNYCDGLSFRWGYYVQLSKNSWAISTPRWVVENSAYKRTYSGGSIITSDNVWYQRTKLTAAPSPSLPSLKNPLSPTHMINGLALLSKAFR